MDARARPERTSVSPVGIGTSDRNTVTPATSEVVSEGEAQAEPIGGKTLQSGLEHEPVRC
jgi:hypothetical protein